VCIRGELLIKLIRVFLCSFVLCAVVANAMALPAGYTQLEYLKSSGTQYIDTGIIASSTNYEYDITFIPQSSSSAVIGNQFEDFLIYYNGVGTLSLYSPGIPSDYIYGNYISFDNVLIDNVYSVHLQYNGNRVVVSENNVQKISYDVGSISPVHTVLLFANHHDAEHEYSVLDLGSVAIMSVKMYNNNTLVRDFVPARRDSDGVLGMYDTVTKTFFTNAGTGTFIAGNDIGIASTSYVQGMYEAINNSKMAKLNPDSIEFTPDSSPYGFFTAVEGAGDKFRFKREEITLPVGSYENPTGRMSIWLE